MKEIFRMRFLNSESDNLKSKIENRTWTGRWTLAFRVVGKALPRLQQ